MKFATFLENLELETALGENGEVYSVVIPYSILGKQIKRMVFSSTIFFVSGFGKIERAFAQSTKLHLKNNNGTEIVLKDSSFHDSLLCDELFDFTKILKKEYDKVIANQPFRQSFDLEMTSENAFFYKIDKIKNQLGKNTQTEDFFKNCLNNVRFKNLGPHPLDRLWTISETPIEISNLEVLLVIVSFINLCLFLL